MSELFKSSSVTTALPSFQPVFVMRLMYSDKLTGLPRYLLHFSHLFHITQNVIAKDQDMALKYVIYCGR
jgi:hypothetical protein